MSIRAIDGSGDWLFGSGLNNYATGNVEIAETIQVTCLSFLNDCFFDTAAGIDWFNFLNGSKSQLAIQLAISAAILSVSGVTGIQGVYVNLNDASRALTIQYSATTVYSTITGAFTYDVSGVI